MANKRKRELADGAPESPQIPAMAANLPVTDTVPELVPGSETLDPLNHGSPAGYEQLREQRIKENLQRMQKLGIADLSLKLKTSVAAKRAPRNFSSERKTPIRVLANEPRRRSSRLKNVEPVSYVENVKLTKQEEKLMKYSILLEEGVKPEFYTEEHEKLLGSTELEWTFFVDGYGADGNRIYDPVNGKTCHQCRQKTLGHRTHCSKCQIVQGQFCGDCLYMRYGEHVLEAKKNPDWICPPCRGICNCSLCRKSRGWAPTGSMYKKIASLGYKSVAHYLIQTMRAPPETEPEETVNNTPHSAKRSLAFTDTEAFADDKETHKKLDYKETENGDLENEKSDHDEDFKEIDVSILNAGNFDGPEIMEAKIEDEKEDKETHKKLDCKETENGDLENEKNDHDDNFKENDVSILNVGNSDGPEIMEAKIEDEREDKETHKKLDCKETENGDLENEKNDHDDDFKENDVSILNVGKSDGPEIMEAKIEDEKVDKTTPVRATKARRSCEPKMDSIARRTRSRCNDKSTDVSL